MAKRKQPTDVTEETNCTVKRIKTEQDKPRRYFDPLHYMGKTEYDLDEIFQEVDNGKYVFTLRSLCPGMAKTILKYKSIIFEHLCGKYNFASIQTIRREEAHPIQGYTSNHDPAVPAVSPLYSNGNSGKFKEQKGIHNSSIKGSWIFRQRQT